MRSGPCPVSFPGFAPRTSNRCRFASSETRAQRLFLPSRSDTKRRAHAYTLSYDCNGTGAQNFEAKRGPTQIKVKGQNLCLDAGTNPKSGSKVHLWQCYPGLKQQVSRIMIAMVSSITPGREGMG